MKIINLKQFRELPPGMVCMKYEPCIFGDLFVKGDSWEYDFILTYITNEIESNDSEEFAEKLFEAQETGCSIKMNFDASMRDGLFEENQLFAIWERDDVDGLINKLRNCLETAYNNRVHKDMENPK